jgi:hypothetical protein
LRAHLGEGPQEDEKRHLLPRCSMPVLAATGSTVKAKSATLIKLF